jgi:hypothetical protein
MKDLTYITTTADLSSVAERQAHLQAGFFADHYTSDLIVLSGYFPTQIFEFVNGKWELYNTLQEHKEITADRYDDLLDCMPPVYIIMLDGVKIQKGFAMGEPYTHAIGTVVSTVCYEKDGKYYMTEACLFKGNGAKITDINSQYYTRENIAITYHKSINLRKQEIA